MVLPDKLVAEPVLLELPDVVLGVPPFALQKLRYQFSMVVKSAAAQLFLHRSAALVRHAARRGSLQKQLSYTLAAASGAWGGTQAPLTSKRTPH